MKSKISIFVFFLVLILFFGCKSNIPVSQEYGYEDIAYLLFVSANDKSLGLIDVIIDENTSFKAKVVKSKDANRKGTSYAVSTGKRKVVVYKKGKILYNKEIILSTQETQKIIL